MHVTEIQAELRRQQLDGWLVASFRGSNPIFGDLTGIPHQFTRRTVLWLPQQGGAALEGECHERSLHGVHARGAVAVEARMEGGPRPAQEARGAMPARRKAVSLSAGARRRAVQRSAAVDAKAGGRVLGRVCQASSDELDSVVRAAAQMSHVRDKIIEVPAGQACEVTRIGGDFCCDVDHDVVVRVGTRYAPAYMRVFFLGVFLTGLVGTDPTPDNHPLTATPWSDPRA